VDRFDGRLPLVVALESNYNRESFFVQHAYFTGGDDPYAHATVSRPFPIPDTGEIAIEVINHYAGPTVQAAPTVR
jgi:adenine-specific DNA-methyltransferase